ncbi:hypothetical protein vseg_011493 [Gypsophila vaccaria]
MALKSEENKIASNAISSKQRLLYSDLEEERTSFLIGNERSCQMLILQVDAAWNTNRRAAAGWVLYGNRLIGEAITSFWATSPLHAEGVGIREAMVWARNNNVRHLKIFSDCKNMIDQIMDDGVGLQHAKSAVNDIRSLSNSFHCISFYFIPRLLNKKAHRLATQALRTA